MMRRTLAALVAAAIVLWGALPSDPADTIALAAAAPVPSDALSILWAKHCQLYTAETPECTVTATSTPVLSPSPTPTRTPSPTPVVTPPGPTPTPTASTTATPTPTPVPTLPPSPSTGGSIGPSVTGLSTSSSAWTSLQTAANASAGTASLTCNQESRTHPGTALAAGLVYARLKDSSPTQAGPYRTKVISLVEQARASAGCVMKNSVLSLGRQLGAYVLAADYVGYRDSAFVAWVSSIRTRDFGTTVAHSRWHQLLFTATDSSNNWGTFALASLIAADLYVGDTTATARDWNTFRHYGDGSSSFKHTTNYQAIWSCPTGYEINPASCTDSRKEGAAVEDASRTTFPAIEGYPAEAAQGYVFSAELLSRAGYGAWLVNDKQICRNALWRARLGKLNFSSADRYVTYMTNARCGLSQPVAGAPMGRIFGFTNWLYP